ncbi:MAG TPA: helix-turn-helix transcriptional regulator [Candidatus Onthocola stercorigallinarum]|nr:helix-turn-helix transcriptional regulator [Candidatus Onthocola stercorigallinarum]
MINSDNYYYDVVRKNIKKYRKLANLTQAELADKSGITMNYLAKIESEKMQIGFSVAVIGRIADALNVDIRNLFDID